MKKEYGIMQKIIEHSLQRDQNRKGKYVIT